MPGWGDWDRRPGGCCRWRRSSVGTSTSMSWPGPRRPRRTSCSTSSNGGGRGVLVRELVDAPVATASPTPSSSTPCTRTSGPTRRARAHRRWPRRWRISAGTVRGRGWANWPGTGSAPPNPSTLQGHRLLPPGGRCRSRCPGSRGCPRATTPRPSTSTRQGTDPDPVLALDLAIGLGTAQRQTGDPPFRETLLDAARRAADLGDTKRLVAAALANNRGFFSAVGAVDTEKVEVLGKLALEPAPRQRLLTGHSCWPP